MNEEIYPIIAIVALALSIGLSTAAYTFYSSVDAKLKRISKDLNDLAQRIEFDAWLAKNPQRFGKGEAVGKYVVRGAYYIAGRDLAEWPRLMDEPDRRVRIYDVFDTESATDETIEEPALQKYREDLMWAAVGKIKKK